MGRLALALILIAATPAVPTAEGTSSLQANPPPQSFQEWQVWDVKTAQPVAFEAWLAQLAARTVIYLGEEHRNRWHIEAALKILRVLVAHELRPTLALEMLGWDGQTGINRYLEDRELPREQFIRESRWQENWGGPFEDYEPLVNFSRTHGLSVLALNPPLGLVRQVAKQGLAQARHDEAMVRWGMVEEMFVDDPAYRSVILDQIRRCHPALPDDAYRRMYDASLFRDEGMAKAIADDLRRRGSSRDGSGPMLVYTGGGHIQYHLPVPNRVSRRLGPDNSVSQTTVYLRAYEPGRAEEIRELLKESIADYVWLTPISVHGPPRRCK